MSEEQGGTTNTTDVAAIQAETVHDVTVYQSVRVEREPGEIFAEGRGQLENGAPTRARELIQEAISRGHDTVEARYHQVLAVLSKRSYRELPAEEREELRYVVLHHDEHDDQWSPALNMLCALIQHLDSAESEPAVALQQLPSMPTAQREQIMRHCALVLTGSIKDNLWSEIRCKAQENQHSHNRRNRAWAYFHPNPAGARVRQPAPIAATLGEQVRAWLAVGLLATGLALLGWTLVRNPNFVGLVSYIGVLSCGSVAIRSGVEWHYRTLRLTAKERAHSRRNQHETTQPGFAKKVSDYFENYARSYILSASDRAAWLAATKGIRTTLRNEVVELYREQRVEDDQVRWLLRHLVISLRKEWQDGTLYAYREQYRTPLSTKVFCVVSTVLAGLAAVGVVNAAMRTDLVLMLACLPLIGTSGRFALRDWCHLYTERRRFAEEQQEADHIYKARKQAHDSWQNQLDRTRPNERQMETWLECDKTLLIEDALHHYKLAWRDILAHAIVHTPAPCRRRARAPYGPWRYQRYHLQLFLITADGVRELNRTLNFEKGSFHERKRNHFRFDAVSSLHVTESPEHEYTLTLTLTNGPARTIEVTEPAKELERSSSHNHDVAQRELESAGFNHALYVLEGISAEGKAWIKYAHSELGRNHAVSGVGSTINAIQFREFTHTSNSMVRDT